MKILTIVQDVTGWSLLSDGYALYKGLSQEGAQNLQAMYAPSVPIWPRKSILPVRRVL